MADVQKLKQMAEAVRQHAKDTQEAEHRRMVDDFQTWIETALSPEMRDVLQLTSGWDQRQQLPMATFELGRERGRIYRGQDENAEIGGIVFTDPDGRETLLAPFHSEDELLLLIEKYL